VPQIVTMRWTEGEFAIIGGVKMVFSNGLSDFVYEIGTDASEGELHTFENAIRSYTRLTWTVENELRWKQYQFKFNNGEYEVGYRRYFSLNGKHTYDTTYEESRANKEYYNAIRETANHYEKVEPEQILADLEFICGVRAVEIRNTAGTSPWEFATLSFKLCNQY
jgi:hypothetical protein